MEVGGVVTDGDGNPIPNAEMEIEKKKIKTDDKGVILEAVTEVEQEEEKPAPAEDKTAELQKQVEELTTENNDLKAKITELEAKKTEMSAEVTAAKKVALEMAEEMKKGIKPDAKVEPTELEKFKNRHLNK
jgi:predicted RNase H-like nuclease (RuvC/YqgF family)